METGVGGAATDQAEGSEPPFVSRRTRLRPVDASDYPTLYQLSRTPAGLLRFRDRGATPGPEEFARSLWEGALAQFVIESRRTPQIVGLISAFNASLRDRYAHIGLLLDPQFHSSAWPLEGAVLFINYLFETFGLRKLYGLVPGYNFTKMASALGEVAKEEALLRDQEHFAGKYWDLHVLAIHRADWEAVRPMALRAILPRSGGDNDAGTVRDSVPTS